MLNRFLGIGERESIGSVLARHRGIGPGFDLLRILLAVYILYGHTIWISGGATSVEGVAAVAKATTAAALDPNAGGFKGWTRPFHVATVPVFFALSGFLVVGSAFRLRRTSTFLAFRFLRIFPALVVETLLCAVVLGGALTTLPLSDYYSHPTFFRYLGNMVGWVSFHLPGVFQSNPVPDIVNTNLWTLPSEFDCYFITAILMAVGILYNRTYFTIAYMVVWAGLLVASLTTGFGLTDGILSNTAITFYFFTGILVYYWRDRIPAHWGLFLLCAAVGYGLMMFEWTAFIAPIPVTYCMAYFGMVAIPKLPLISKGDYSYGIYLYGFPIAQALVAIFPETLVGHRYLTLLCVAVASSAFAVFSWHAIEIHALKLKKRLPPRWFAVPPKVVVQTPEERAVTAGV